MISTVHLLCALKQPICRILLSFVNFSKLFCWILSFHFIFLQFKKKKTRTDFFIALLNNTISQDRSIQFCLNFKLSSELYTCFPVYRYWPIICWFVGLSKLNKFYDNSNTKFCKAVMRISMDFSPFNKVSTLRKKISPDFFEFHPSGHMNHSMIND